MIFLTRNTSTKAKANLIKEKKGQRWWEISRNPNPDQALAEELNEILAEARWYRKLAFEVGSQRSSNYNSSEDLKNFWKKWSDGGHFWHPQKRRWYAEKWWA